MRKLTQKQTKDIETIEWFCPKFFTGETIYPCGAIPDPLGDDPIDVFLDFSDKGIKFIGRRTNDLSKLERLIQGKRYRGVMIGEYEHGVLNGDVPYSTLLQGVPESVKDFLKKEMFKGMDAECIESVWGLVNS